MCIVNLLSSLNIKVKSFTESSSPNVLHLLLNGSIAFVDGRVDDTIFIVDPHFNDDVANFALAHELGHVLCRRDGDNQLTKMVKEANKYPILFSDPEFMEKANTLKMEEEFKVDVFALYLLFNNSINLTEREARMYTSRRDYFLSTLSADKMSKLNGQAQEMIKSILKY